MVNNKTSVKVNFIMNFILTLSNFIFPLISFPYVSRVLGASGIGTVNFASSIVAYFTMIAMLGIPTYGIRACAKVRDDRIKLSKTVQEILIINSVVMIIAIAALFISVFSIDRLAAEKELYMILGSAIVFNVLGVDWLYRSLEQYTYITVRSILFKIVSLILLLIFIKEKTDYLWYGAITVFAGAGSNVLNFLYLKKFVSLKVTEKLEFQPHLKPIFTFFLLSVSTTIYLNVDATMLGFMKGDQAVGYYSAAVKIKQILVSIVTSLGAVLLPRLSYYYESGEMDRFKELIQRSLHFVFFISIPLVCFFTVMSHESILFLSGREFLPAAVAMQFIMPTVLFIGLSNLTGIQILVPMHKEHLVVYSTVVGAALDMVINVFLIPVLAEQGAAIAGTFAELAVLLVQIYCLKALVLPLFKQIEMWKIIVASIVAIVAIVMLKNSVELPLFFGLIVTSMVYFTVYGMCLILFKDQAMIGLQKSILAKLRR